MSSIYREPRSKLCMLGFSLAVWVCMLAVGVYLGVRLDVPATSSTTVNCRECHISPPAKAARAKIIYKLKVTAQTQAALLRELENAQ